MLFTLLAIDDLKPLIFTICVSIYRVFQLFFNGF